MWYPLVQKDFAAFSRPDMPERAAASRAVTPTSTNSDVPHRMVRGARRVDFASRLKARLRTLKTRLGRREAMIDVVRDANLSLDPHMVATWLVGQAEEWMPAPCWAVVVPDVAGQLTTLADKGLSPALAPSLWFAASWVIRYGSELVAADVSKQAGADELASGTAIAFPLESRNALIGVLVGLDPRPSATRPPLTHSVVQTIGMLLEPAAIALDNALTIQKAEALSVTDDLTGLYNSRYLNLVLRREEKRSVRSGKPLSVLFIDMDGFKNVNTQYGHLAGSKALVEAGAVIRGCARETDVVSRFGGDEFAVILPDTGRDGAVFVAERICDRLRAFRFLETDGLAVHLTASVGIATLPDVTSVAEELLRAADRAMYQVKDSGKDGIHIAVKE
jgi:diguanylate cyclase (GGDEF)-like protein